MGPLIKIVRFMSDSQTLWKFPRKRKLKFFNFSFILQNHGFCSDAKNPSRFTIFALSTPPGVSAIAVIRISGPNASDVLFKMGKIKKLPEARKASLCRIKDPVSDELLDKALVLWFPSPNSFTSENMCELHIHGGIAVVKSVLSALMKLPHFRMAEPGEFTKRAFLANKFDLTEVEGLNNLLHAETEIQQKQALRQMDGSLNKLYNEWSSKIKKCLANVEAYIDFSEDQHLEGTILKSDGDERSESGSQFLDPRNNGKIKHGYKEVKYYTFCDTLSKLIQSDLDKLKVEMKSHITDCRRGERLRNGVSTVLIGKPNVGKSSLLNNLCQRDIAIVSPTAGTTRDIIETSFNLDGYLVNISDTAGIRETADSIELEGVKRAKNRSDKADLLLFILEAKRALEIYESSKISNENFVNHLLLSELGEFFLKDLTKSTNENEDSNITTLAPENGCVIILLNKIDLLSEEEKTKVVHLENYFDFLCAISCTEGFGMNKFLSTFTNAVKNMCSNYRGEEPIITQERHRMFIANCLQNIINYEECLKIDIALAAENLRVAMNELGKITGKVRVDDILDVVFKDFCIGK